MWLLGGAGVLVVTENSTFLVMMGVCVGWDDDGFVCRTCSSSRKLYLLGKQLKGADKPFLGWDIFCVRWVFVFRMGFKAHRLLYHSTLGCRVIKKRRRMGFLVFVWGGMLRPWRCVCWAGVVTENSTFWVIIGVCVGW